MRNSNAEPRTTPSSLKRAALSRTGLVMVLLAFSSSQLHAQASRFSGSARGHDYIHALIGPTAWLGVAAATALDEIRDDPPQWDVWDRALSNTGRLAVQTTIHHGLAAAMDRSTWYYRCGCSDTGGRIVHAFAEAVTDHDRQGHTHLGLARIAAAYGAAAAESTWRLGRSDILLNGTSSLVGSGILNLWREFFTHASSVAR